VATGRAFWCASATSFAAGFGLALVGGAEADVVGTADVAAGGVCADGEGVGAAGAGTDCDSVALSMAGVVGGSAALAAVGVEGRERSQPAVPTPAPSDSARPMSRGRELP
jgi:hypothetical protein